MFSESIDTELKEFNFPVSSLTNDDIKNIHENIISGKFWGNSRVMNSLKLQIQKYFLKYLSGWNHSEFDFDYGKLYFGIDDLGKIIGIPFQGDIDKKTILSWINIELTKSKMTPSQKSLFLSKFNCYIVPVKPDFQNTMELYLENLDKEKNKIEAMKDFTKEYSKWSTRMSRYTVKLVDFLNFSETKEELINYIEEHNPDEESKNQIISYLRSKSKWEPLPAGEIKHLKADTKNMYYWLTMFKDLKTWSIKMEKPVIENFKLINYDKFYSSPKIMNYQFSKDPSIKFYIIRFDIPNLKEKIYVKTKYGEIIYRRCLTELGPCSTPLLS
jgi:hypothetical protein